MTPDHRPLAAIAAERGVDPQRLRRAALRGSLTALRVGLHWFATDADVTLYLSTAKRGRPRP